MLSSQILLSRRGAFIEIIRNRVGDVSALMLLQPQYTFPIPDAERFIAGYSVEYPNQPKRIIEPENVMWVRVPHPTDPYKGQTPLESAGLAIEFDYYSRVYNRNFVINDGRPGGILVVKGDLEDEVSEEIARRFRGATGSNIGGAGRTTVISADDASFIDTAVNQRDAQYTEARAQNKEEILLAFGVPESVLGNAAGRTFANADTELEVFWRETMLPHLTLIERGLDILDDDPKTYFVFDLSSVAILSRDDRDRSGFHLEELKQGAITIDEYRELTGRKGVGMDELLVPTNLSPVAIATDGSGAPEGGLVNPNQRPGRRPGDRPDDAVPRVGQPSSSAPTSPRVQTDNSNDPNPRPIYEPALTPLAMPIEEGKAPEVSPARTRARQVERLEASVALQIGSFFKRQQRVIGEKAASKKFKERWDNNEGIIADDIFDMKVWNAQLAADANTWISAVFLDGAVEIAGDGFDKLDMQEKSVSELISNRVEHILVVNETTRRNIDKIISEYLGRPHAAFKAALDDWMSKSFTIRAKTIVKTEVSGAFNAGLLWAAKQLGYTRKTWIHIDMTDGREEHHLVSDSTIGIDEAFDVSGKALQFPGDFDSEGHSAANCRCTLHFE
jgi:HK97 family phage portal protein